MSRLSFVSVGLMVEMCFIQINIEDGAELVSKLEGVVANMCDFVVAVGNVRG